MASKRKTNSNLEDHNGIRLTSHEKVCAERMKTLFKSMDEVKKEIKELRADMNKGKGAVNVLVFMAGLLAAIIGFFKWNG
jgi:uncharacterized coiled-coil DUF342 family protein